MGVLPDARHLILSFYAGICFGLTLCVCSSHCLPEPYRALMSAETSPILDFYPVKFDVDMNGKKQSWLAVVLLPFIDETRCVARFISAVVMVSYVVLLVCLSQAVEATAPLEATLTPLERERNMLHDELLYAGPSHTLYDILSALSQANRLNRTSISCYPFVTFANANSLRVQLDPAVTDLNGTVLPYKFPTPPMYAHTHIHTHIHTRAHARYLPLSTYYRCCIVSVCLYVIGSGPAWTGPRPSPTGPHSDPSVWPRARSATRSCHRTSNSRRACCRAHSRRHRCLLV